MQLAERRCVSIGLQLGVDRPLGARGAIGFDRKSSSQGIFESQKGGHG
eukprot:CAMPEP_0115580310 /NCGR_PEP_ID=MMETSP0272-20121206/4557_1 /TAXON_ID=71861 /ORGANISM="Scrippsiella trochoidea, Strain CCMP3099" /LENGTH=47 /DNA_ID= /DNA_START= /DNA_END= /DNA_ORIENTATION=